MTFYRLLTATALAVAITLGAVPSFAQSRDRGGRHDAARAAGPAARESGRAVPRAVYPPRFVRPSIVGIVPYRPYLYRPRLGFGLGYGYPYVYGYSPYGYSPYGYFPYGYPPYGYPAPPAYLYAVPGRPYGGVRIEGVPRDAAVYADGYYVGVVDDFDGVFQHMNLEAGPHRIEIRAAGYAPIEFDVNLQPGQTITYRADLLQP